MPKVCIIAPSSLRYVPYLRYYEDVLNDASVQYEILFWDRFGTGESRPNALAYCRRGTAQGAALVPAYLGFRRFLKHSFSSRRYDLYIVLSVQVGVLLYDFLRTRRFVLDVRDYSHEAFWPFRVAAFDLARRARMVAISSRGFLDWLPRGPDYVVSHNVSRGHLERTAVPFDRDRKVVSYIGAIGYYDANVRFLEGAAGQSDWDIRYIGRGTCERQLEERCRRRGITNVTFRGAFGPEEKARLFDEANFILAIYGDDSPVVRTATPNRLYEACLHRRPLIVNRGTHLAAIVEENGLGVAIDLDDASGWGAAVDRFYEAGHYQWYVENADEFLECVKKDLATFERRVRGVLAECGGTA